MTTMPIEETRQVTIELPEPIFRLLSQLAEESQQSLEMLAAQSVTGNLPPSVENAPVSLRDDLLRMQSLSVEELREIADERIDPAQQSRHVQLLERNEEGTLTAEENQELVELRTSADDLMIRKAYAWALLRWRGHRVPPLSGLPLP